MKLSTKLLVSLGAVAILFGDTASAALVPSSVSNSYKAYREAYNADPQSEETGEALDDLRTSCDYFCNTFSCNISKKAKDCAARCPFDTVGSCLKQQNVSSNPSRKKFLEKLNVNDIDENDVPMSKIPGATVAASSVKGTKQEDGSCLCPLQTKAPGTNTANQQQVSKTPSTPVVQQKATTQVDSACQQAANDYGISPEEAKANGLC